MNQAFMHKAKCVMGLALAGVLSVSPLTTMAEDAAATASPSATPSAAASASPEATASASASAESAAASEASASAETSASASPEASAAADSTAEPETASVSIKDVDLEVGADETKRNIHWLSTSSAKPKILLAEASKSADGKTLPQQGTTHLSGTAVEAQQDGWYSCSAVMTGIKPNTKYLYQVGSDDGWSETYSFTTQDYGNGTEFSFLFAGDPQIGASGNDESDAEGWQTTLNNALTAFPTTDFVLSAGDQVQNNNKKMTDEEKYSRSENEYDLYLSTDQNTSLPEAVNVGNHDERLSNFSNYYNMPNQSDKGISTNAGVGDYWFTYNGVLFMSLNSNNTSTAEHKAFMQDVMAQNPDALWNVVTFHHSTLSSADHYTDDDIIQRRNELDPVFTELGIDVVLMGHDHYYTRTYMMNGNDPITPSETDKYETDANGTVTAYNGQEDGEVLYLTANSASGSKYYALNDQFDAAYAARNDQANTPSIVNITVTADEFKVDSYYSNTALSEPYDTFTVRKEEKEPLKDINLEVGADETQRNLNWMSTSSEQGKVEYAEASLSADGTTFPSSGYTTAAADTEASTVDSYYANKATLTGIKENTKYLYRVINGDDVSETYSFTTQDYGDGTEFSFLFAGDPQIGASGDDAADEEGWQTTMANALAAFPNTDFLYSAGDQVNNGGGQDSDLQTEYYLSPESTTSLPQAVNVGNHDNRYANYSDYYNMPNESDEYGVSEGAGTNSGDYYFTYNGVLFMSLNSNNMNTSEHKAFMESALQANPDALWKVVTFHHATLSAANHYTDDDIIARRNELDPLFSELDIDVVLMGHDHYYTRTYMMKGNDPITPSETAKYDVADDSKTPSVYTDPADGEVLYLTANSASGSKYYKLNKNFAGNYSAVNDQQNRPSITNVTVTKDTFTVETYYTDQELTEPFDTFTIKRTSAAADNTGNNTENSEVKTAANTKKAAAAAKNTKASGVRTGVEDHTDEWAMGLMIAVAGAAVVYFIRRHDAEA